MSVASRPDIARAADERGLLQRAGAGQDDDLGRLAAVSAGADHPPHVYLLDDPVDEGVAAELQDWLFEQVRSGAVNRSLTVAAPPRPARLPCRPRGVPSRGRERPGRAAARRHGKGQAPAASPRLAQSRADRLQEPRGLEDSPAGLQEKGKPASQPVSRVLFRRPRPPAAVIYLGPGLLRRSSGLPGSR